MKPIKLIVRFFDKLEDFAREHLSRHPIPYAIIGGVVHVLFWRSVWESADVLYHLGGVWQILFYPPLQILITAAILMLTGLMVSSFIGDRIILSGLKHEKKVFEKTEEEVEKEESELKVVLHRLTQIENKLDSITKNTQK
jgi:uncharacterized membrane protein (DUF106 family)